MTLLDVLCVGHACYDMVFAVDEHPPSDSKIVARELLQCGGGPAANAAVTVARLGFKAGFSGYLGQDSQGESHLRELLNDDINIDWLVRGHYPTPLSVVLVKPDGQRSLVNYKGATRALSSEALNYNNLNAKVLLFDGHEPQLCLSLLNLAKDQKIPTVLDAGSWHEGTELLYKRVDYLVASEKFARHFSDDMNQALTQLAAIAPHVVITLGEKGLIWQSKTERGQLPALSIQAVDTTGAGDAFHGAFAAALAQQMDWISILAFASAAGTYCCTQKGARLGLPDKEAHAVFFDRYQRLFLQTDTPIVQGD